MYVCAYTSQLNTHTTLWVQFYTHAPLFVYIENPESCVLNIAFNLAFSKGCVQSKNIEKQCSISYPDPVVANSAGPMGQKCGAGLDEWCMANSEGQIRPTYHFTPLPQPCWIQFTWHFLKSAQDYIAYVTRAGRAQDKHHTQHPLWLVKDLCCMQHPSQSSQRGGCVPCSVHPTPAGVGTADPV